MKKNRFFSLFQKDKRFTHALTGNPLDTLFAESGSLINNQSGSPLIVGLIKDDLELQQYYKNYLVAYQDALRNLNKQDYHHARLKVREALSNLVKVDVIPAALAKDFGRITELTDLIEENIPQKKY